jgi:hypothetical protein
LAGERSSTYGEINTSIIIAETGEPTYGSGVASAGAADDQLGATRSPPSDPLFHRRRYHQDRPGSHRIYLTSYTNSKGLWHQDLIPNQIKGSITMVSDSLQTFGDHIYVRMYYITI